MRSLTRFVIVFAGGCSGGAEAERPLSPDHPANPQASEDSYVPPRNPFEGELTTVTPEAKGDPYACPMHPEVKSSKPGNCPKCGMKLEPGKQKEGSESYTCPMHPEIQSSKPGDCPKCGMKLEPKKD